MSFTFELKESSHQPGSLPIEVDGLVPDALPDTSIETLRQHLVWCGNQQQPIDDFFAITENDGPAWRFVGDLSRVHGLGTEMTSGEILVEGSIGRRLGAGMRGGLITVSGDAGDFAGVEMRGGRIHIKGDAGDHLGGVLSGSPRGMRGGLITLAGSAGNYGGQAMRRGMIAIQGNCGDFVAARMLAGSILVGGDCGNHPGLEMKRGTLCLFGKNRPQLPPTFRYGCDASPQALSLMLGYLKQQGFEFSASIKVDSIAIHHGDLLRGGRGEVFTLA